MSTKTHKRLCWNCDGYVHVYEVKCPYCAVSLLEQIKEGRSIEEKQSLSQSMEEKNTQIAFNEFQPPYQNYGANFNEPEIKKIEPIKKELNSKPAADIENPFAALILVLPGTVLFLLGLTMLLFSSEGKLIFQFKAKFWFVYLLGSLPLLYAGYRLLFPKDKEIRSSYENSSFTNPLER